MQAIQTARVGSMGTWIPEQNSRTSASVSSFAEIMSRAASGKVQAKASAEQAEEYMAHLRSKYGQVRLESVGRDDKSLRKAAGSMRGSDVIIAPNIFESMVADPVIGAAYESEIDEFFAATPRLKQEFAAKGLTYEPCGVVVHEDGTVTYICGGGDTPERVSEVNRINARRDAERSERRKRYFEMSESRLREQRALQAKARAALDQSGTAWRHTAGALALTRSHIASGFDSGLVLREDARLFRAD